MTGATRGSSAPNWTLRLVIEGQATPTDATKFIRRKLMNFCRSLESNGPEMAGDSPCREVCTLGGETRLELASSMKQLSNSGEDAAEPSMKMPIANARFPVH